MTCSSVHKQVHFWQQARPERQPGLAEFAAEAILIPAGAVGGYSAEREACRAGVDRQVIASRQLGPELTSPLSLAKCRLVY
jgi:hypothetical protein